MTPATESTIGRASVIGLAFAPFAILFCFWIPTLALLFALATMVGGALDLPGSSGPRRRAALLTMGLGLVPIVLVAVIVMVGLATGPEGGTGRSFA